MKNGNRYNKEKKIDKEKAKRQTAHCKFATPIEHLYTRYLYDIFIWTGLTTFGCQFHVKSRTFSWWESMIAGIIRLDSKQSGCVS